MSAFSEKVCCRKHCTYWTYSSSASFHNLEHVKDNDSHSRQDRPVYSRIHVFYSDFEYRQYKQVKETNFYRAFCDFGNVMVLWWGISIISIFEVLFYVRISLLVLLAKRAQTA